MREPPHDRARTDRPQAGHLAPNHPGHVSRRSSRGVVVGLDPRGSLYRRLRQFPRRLWGGTHHEGNPYARANRVLDGWDEHERAIVGDDAGDDIGGGRAHGDGGPTTTGDGIPQANLPGVRDGDTGGTVLHLPANPDARPNPTAQAGADDRGVPADVGAGRVVRLRPVHPVAPSGGYLMEPRDG